MTFLKHFSNTVHASILENLSSFTRTQISNEITFDFLSAEPIRESLAQIMISIDAICPKEYDGKPYYRVSPLITIHKYFTASSVNRDKEGNVGLLQATLNIAGPPTDMHFYLDNQIVASIQSAPGSLFLYDSRMSVACSQNSIFITFPIMYHLQPMDPFEQEQYTLYMLKHGVKEYIALHMLKQRLAVANVFGGPNPTLLQFHRRYRLDVQTWKAVVFDPFFDFCPNCNFLNVVSTTVCSSCTLHLTPNNELLTSRLADSF
jgi:hypothetical protein